MGSKIRTIISNNHKRETLQNWDHLPKKNLYLFQKNLTTKLNFDKYSKLLFRIVEQL